MEIKNIPIYKNDMSENAPVANEDFASRFKFTPLVYGEKVAGFLAGAHFDKVDQILGDFWILDELFKNEFDEYFVSNIECQIDKQDEQNIYTPIAVHLEKTNSEPVQLTMEDV